MKVIYLISRARVSGPVNQASYIIRGINRSKDDEAILCTIAPEFKNNSRIHLFHDNNIRVFCLESKAWLSYSAISKLRKFIKQEKIDVIHSSGLRANLLSSLMPRRVRKISTQRSSPTDIGEKFPKILRKIITHLYISIIKKIPVNVACSKSLSETFSQKFLMNIPFVQNGVDTDMFFPVDDEKKIAMKAELGLNPNVQTFLILGSLNARKNNDVAIEAFNCLKDDTDVQLIIVGGGAQEKHLKEIAKSPNIIFYGKTSTPLKYLQASDVLISCSLAEGLPNTVLEALSCGLPCILSEIAPHKELIEGSDAGLIYSPNTAGALLDAISNARGWGKEKSKAARNIALQYFSIDVLADKYRALYHSI